MLSMTSKSGSTAQTQVNSAQSAQNKPPVLSRSRKSASEVVYAFLSLYIYIFFFLEARPKNIYFGKTLKKTLLILDRNAVVKPNTGEKSE